MYTTMYTTKYGINTIQYIQYTLAYICMPLQHPVAGPAAQVPDPNRVIC